MVVARHLFLDDPFTPNELHPIQSLGKKENARKCSLEQLSFQQQLFFPLGWICFQVMGPTQIFGFSQVNRTFLDYSL